MAYIPGAGNFAVTDDSTQDRILILDPACSLLASFNTQTFGINSPNPSGIAYRSKDGTLAFTDLTRDSVAFFNSSRPGRIQSQFGTALFGSSRPEGVGYFPRTDRFAVIDRDVDRVSIFNSRGVLVQAFSTASFSLNPTDIAYDPLNGIVAIVDDVDDEVSFLRLPALDAGPPVTPCLGDFDNDGDVDGSDLTVFSRNFGRTDCPLALARSDSEARPFQRLTPASPLPRLGGEERGHAARIPLQLRSILRPQMKRGMHA